MTGVVIDGFLGLGAIACTGFGVLFALSGDLRWVKLVMVAVLLWGIFIYEKIKARKEEQK